VLITVKTITAVTLSYVNWHALPEQL